ncbi:MAG TPA: hypothetical protein VMV10_25620 [Pirellulales bacterium]|nr:hypothetical protein [Pirellulales bacterium]
MASSKTHCAVVEIPVSSQGGPDDAPPRDLLPWADPYIARLLSKHRLQAALDDSLTFVENEAFSRSQRPLPAYESTLSNASHGRPRFNARHPFSD